MQGGSHRAFGVIQSRRHHLEGQRLHYQRFGNLENRGSRRCYSIPPGSPCLSRWKFYPGSSEGIVFQGSTFQQTPICALNRIDTGVAEPILGIGNLPEDSMVVGGATSKGGTTEKSGAGRLIAGLGSPEGKVVGNLGDIFQRVGRNIGRSTRTGANFVRQGSG